MLFKNKILNQIHWEGNSDGTVINYLRILTNQLRIMVQKSRLLMSILTLVLSDALYFILPQTISDIACTEAVVVRLLKTDISPKYESFGSSLIIR